jgi:AraC-like DNA-binding protein
MEEFSFFFTLTGLNVCRFWPGSSQLDIHMRGPFSREAMGNVDFPGMLGVGRGERDTKSDSSGNAAMQCSDDNGLNYIGARRDGYWLFLGPYLTEDQVPAQGGRRFSLMSRMPVLNGDQVASYFAVAQLYSRHGFPQKAASGESPALSHNPVFEESSQIDFNTIEMMYSMERNLRDAIAAGDRKAILRLQGESAGGSMAFSHRMPGNPLRVQKNLAVVVNTIGRHAAEKGGLPPYLLHHLSDDYAIRIEACRNQEELQRLQGELMLAYCDAVRNYGVQNHSAAVSRVCSYIIQHLCDRLSLDELAQIAGLSPSYFSRRFREETDRTVSGYIREKRVAEARWLLARTERSVTDIALSLGFEDVNYFSRSFRSETGTAPRDYRKSRWRKDFDGLPG